jgi:hypothetical protein
MPSELEHAIQQHIIQYLDGVVSLAEFEEWFVPILWDIDDEDPRVRELAGTIHILIAEFSRGDRTATDLREHLADAVRTADVSGVR